MKVKTNKKYKGANITLNSNDLCNAINLYLYSKGVYVNGPRTVKINGESPLGQGASVYVDPSGGCIYKGEQIVIKN